jgi:tight adherence protein B
MVNLPPGTLAAVGLIFFAVVLATIALVLFLEALRDRARRRDVTKQLEKLSLDDIRTDENARTLFRRDAQDLPAWLQPFASRLPQMRDIDVLIEQAALAWSSKTFVILTVGFGSAFGLASLIAFGSLLPFIAGTAVGASLPYFYIRRKRETRMRAFEEGLPEAIDLLGRALRAGHPLSSGLKMVADETQDPIAMEFRRVFEEQRFGLGMEESLLGMADRIPLVDVRIFVTAVLIQREVGGNLAEILDKLSEVIRQRFSIMRQLRTFTAQGRMSGYILGGLPIFLGLVLFLISRDDMLAFATHPLGRLLMMVAVVLQVLGYIWISRIVKIEV